MKNQYTSRVIIYSIFNNKKKYLLLRDSYGKCNFFKSEIRKDVIPTKELKNEIQNKLGLKKYEFVPGFLKTKKFVFTFESELITKLVNWYLVFSGTRKLNKDFNYVWLLLNEARYKLENFYEKKILNQADIFLNIPRLI